MKKQIMTMKRRMCCGADASKLEILAAGSYITAIGGLLVDRLLLDLIDPNPKQGRTRFH